MPFALNSKRLPHRLALAALWCALHPAAGLAQEQNWSVGLYAGKYYDTEPAGFLSGRAGFVEQHLLAATAKTTLWQSATQPLALELDGMVGLQTGVATLTEVAVAPALRWSGFPWNGSLKTSVSAAPFGISYTSKVSPLELGRDGKGSQVLNWLFLEVAVSSPSNKQTEFFARLHHRCTVYDLLNNYGANGEDFFALGFRRKF
ncbi:MAG: hypothetical protein CFE44_09755 [Burkholderiales bacterium PBB4]|nr:MAG: hypothetical protein CFE44_09755 [Burkholderiales bacterium PBB4]